MPSLTESLLSSGSVIHDMMTKWALRLFFSSGFLISCRKRGEKYGKNSLLEGEDFSPDKDKTLYRFVITGIFFFFTFQFHWVTSQIISVIWLLVRSHLKPYLINCKRRSHSSPSLIARLLFTLDDSVSLFIYNVLINWWLRQPLNGEILP